MMKRCKEHKLYLYANGMVYTCKLGCVYPYKRYVSPNDGRWKKGDKMAVEKPRFVYMIYDKQKKEYFRSSQNKIWLNPSGAKSAIRHSGRKQCEVHTFELKFNTMEDMTNELLVEEV